ncbi:MAG: hypothetical protein AAB538_05920, partial [Patescibacteria group bacterium]
TFSAVPVPRTFINLFTYPTITPQPSTPPAPTAITGKPCNLQTECPRPFPGAPNFYCADGTIGGPACVRFPDGHCGWQFRQCPKK